MRNRGGTVLVPVSSGVLARVLSGLSSAGSGVIVFLVAVAVIVLSRGRWTAPRSDATVREVA